MKDIKFFVDNGREDGTITSREDNSDILVWGQEIMDIPEWCIFPVISVQLFPIASATHTKS